ncbi:chorismate mutase, partial [Escherichia coli]|nr:chorismate mutase [Escherichia coli]
PAAPPASPPASPPTAGKKPAPERAAVRAELAATDKELVSLLANRMRLIREVARVKAEKDLPSFDREREGAHLDDLLARAKEDGVPDDVVRDVFARLFAASRLEQRR